MGKGGGNDGYTLTSQRKLIVKTKSQEYEKSIDNTTQKEINVARMNTCAYSGEKLQEPIVCDEYGNLYNKESILTLILHNKLNQETIPNGYQHIKSIKKDIINIHPTLIKSNNITTSSNGPLFICPLTQLEANGNQPFVVLRKCGCLISERAYKAMCISSVSSSSTTISSSTTTTLPGSNNNTTSMSVCPICSTALATNEDGGPYIKLCPTNEELTLIKERLHERSQQKQLSKKGIDNNKETIPTLPNIESTNTNDPSSLPTIILGQKRPRSPDTTSTFKTTSSIPPHSSLSLQEQQTLLSTLAPTINKQEQIITNRLTQNINQVVQSRIQEQSTKSNVYSSIFQQSSRHPDMVSITTSANTGTFSSSSQTTNHPHKK